ncbi:MAG: hypothetical protein QOF78_2002 [Phycisphaerales bacterium]|jgi:hypothetical protein|nr:hypothetical protein [Phycisphaerales bacterium]
MRNRFFVAVLIVVISFIARVDAAPAPTTAPAVGGGRAGSAGAGGEALPTMQQLNQMLSEGKSQDVLRHVAKLLALKGEAAKGYDRYDLLCLRGEGALRTKANTMAIDAFAQAARATEDSQKQAVARATELLIRRAKPLGYVPRVAAPAPANAQADAAAAKAKPGTPIPYIEAADRKRAFAAMLIDEMAVVDPKVKAATKSEALPPIIDAIKSLGDLRAVEIAAKGTSTETKGLSADLGTHAHHLISDTIRPMSKRVEECWRSASRYSISGNDVNGLWGLTSAEQYDLKAVIATCEKVQPVASELATVTDRAELIADAQAAQKLHARASEVLSYDYANAGRYNKDPKKPAGAR